ncbi:MAG TPA: hypothetical protein VN739_07900 [Nitrososphaerales archaeon]|nr:hypothetical protein [Nitrososphaerales archaeon]
METKFLVDPEQHVRDLKGPFDLSSERKKEAQYFEMETKYIHFGMNGKRLGTESYLLKIQYIPKAENVDEYRCSELQLQINDGPFVTIPELSNWSYVFNPMLSGADERGPLWGIPQEKFTNINDSLGKALPFSIRYAVYTNFIDFHSINDIFARPMKFGKGIQDLKDIGQRIVHPASFMEASVNFDAEIKPGSTFRNGEVSLELKGLSLVDGSPCALVAYDAGESNLKMIIPVSADQDSVSVGGSQYKGDIFVDLATRWVRKATLDEYLVTETSAPDSPAKINQYTTRHIILRLIS